MSDAELRARRERQQRIERGQDTLREADEALAERKARRVAGSLTFRSVPDLLAWWGEAEVRIQGANAMHPRTEAVPTASGNGSGERCVVRVDGGPGGSVDDVHATLASVRGALARLGREAERRAARRGRPPAVEVERYHVLLVDRYVHGMTLEALAKREGVGESALSAHLGKAERVLADLLFGSVIT